MEFDFAKGLAMHAERMTREFVAARKGSFLLRSRMGQPISRLEAMPVISKSPVVQAVEDVNAGILTPDEIAGR